MLGNCLFFTVLGSGWTENFPKRSLCGLSMSCWSF